MAYARKKGSTSNRNSGRNSSSGRGAVKRPAGSNRKSGAAKPASRRVTTEKPQKLVIEIITTDPGATARPVGINPTVRSPRKAQF